MLSSTPIVHFLEDISPLPSPSPVYPGLSMLTSSSGCTRMTRRPPSRRSLPVCLPSGIRRQSGKAAMAPLLGLGLGPGLGTGSSRLIRPSLTSLPSCGESRCTGAGRSGMPMAAVETWRGSRNAASATTASLTTSSSHWIRSMTLSGACSPTTVPGKSIAMWCLTAP